MIAKAWNEPWCHLSKGQYNYIMFFTMKWLFPYDCVAKYFYMLSLFLALSDIKQTSMILIPSMMHSQKPGMAGLWHIVLFFRFSALYKADYAKKNHTETCHGGFVVYWRTTQYESMKVANWLNPCYFQSKKKMKMKDQPAKTFLAIYCCN